jgi:serine/threonine-protein kinase
MRLSAGGMAELFLALQRSSLGFEKLVVLKRILPHRSTDSAFVEMFLREARIAATLTHPNVVQTFDAGELEGTYFIVMEHVHGEDLRTVLSAVKSSGKQALPLEHALHVALGMCSGLAYVHEKRDLFGNELGIVHCDVSTRNVVVSFAGDVKIVDFGIATTDLDEGSLPGRVKGKARFMSPEQAAGEALDARADIFSTGVVLFELTTGARLFQGASDLPTLRSMHKQGYPRPSELVAGYPPGLEQIVQRALQKQRAERYPSARAMQSDLEAFIRSEGVSVSSIEVATFMRSLFERKLASQTETLRELKGLAAAVSAAASSSGAGEPPRDGRPAATGAVGESVAPHALNLAPKGKWRGRTPAVLVAIALGAVGALFYMQHQKSVRIAEALRRYRDEQALRLAARSEARQPTGSLEIVSRPGGCAVWINGAQRPEVTPAKVEDLPLERELHIKLTKEGFEPYRVTARLTADAPFKDIDAQMQDLSATVLLQSDWRVSFNLFVDGVLWRDRAKVDGLNPHEEHVLAFYSPGYLPKTVRLLLEPGETRTVEVHLVKSRTGPE